MHRLKHRTARLRGSRPAGGVGGAAPGKGRLCLHRHTARGFTLIELIIVLAIIGILLAMAVPNYRTSIRASQEAVLHDDLFQLRTLINQYTLDKQQAPQSLDDLVSAGYLQAIPVDPITHSATTWQTESDDTMMSPYQTESGITNVHSGASGTGLDGTAYSSW